MNADEDRKTQEMIELKNQAESLAYQTEKTLKELGDKVDEATRQSVTRGHRGRAQADRRATRSRPSEPPSPRWSNEPRPLGQASMNRPQLSRRPGREGALSARPPARTLLPRTAMSSTRSSGREVELGKVVSG